MAYGRQFRTTRADNRLRPDYTAALNEKLKFLPQRMEQQANEQRHQDSLAMDERRLAQANRQFQQSQQMQQKQYAQREREQEVGMGLEAAKAGLGYSMSGGSTLRERLGSGALKPATAPSGWTPGTGTGTGGAAKGGLFSGIGSSLKRPFKPVTNFVGKHFGHLTVGNTIGAGLLGFGAGKLFGGKSKVKKFGIGAAAGGLASLFGGGGAAGGGGKDFITGSLFGGLGGLF